VATKTAEADAKADEAKGGGKKKLILIIVPVVLLAAAAAAWFFLLRGGGEAAAEEEKEPEHTPGVVVRLDSVTVNLAGSHYLKLGLALQQDHALGEESLDGAKALDAAIEHFSGMAMDELATAEGREHAKAELTELVAEAYEDEIYDVYFTEFVMQ
jgi:flagellar FliL protein